MRIAGDVRYFTENPLAEDLGANRMQRLYSTFRRLLHRPLERNGIHIPTCAQLEKRPCPAKISLHSEQANEHWWSGWPGAYCMKCGDTDLFNIEDDELADAIERFLNIAGREIIK